MEDILRDISQYVNKIPKLDMSSDECEDIVEEFKEHIRNVFTYESIRENRGLMVSPETTMDECLYCRGGYDGLIDFINTKFPNHNLQPLFEEYDFALRILITIVFKIKSKYVYDEILLEDDEDIIENSKEELIMDVLLDGLEQIYCEENGSFFQRLFEQIYERENKENS